MTNSSLSPAAQAVFNAAWTCPIVLGDHPATRSRQIAAALRAAADQVVPSVPLNLNARGTLRRHRAIRDKEIRILITAIAAELEAK